MKIQLLTNEQVNHLLNSLQRPLTKTLEDKIEEIKKVEVTDEKVEAEISITRGDSGGSGGRARVPRLRRAEAEH